MSRVSRATAAAIALSVGILVALLGDHLRPHLPLLDKFNATCVTLPYSSQQTIVEHDQQTNTFTIRNLTKNNTSPLPFQLIRIGNDPDGIFEKTPPSALDYAVILESLHNQGYRRVNLTTKLSWDDSPRLLAAGLDTRLALFDSAVLPLSLSRAPSTGEMPPMLKNTFIPSEQIHGDPSLIPTVNRLTIPPAIQGSSQQTYAGFHEIENIPPSPNKIPMLAQWQDGSILPSATLLTIMQAHQVTPSSVIIHCEKFIRLGKNGPVIAIDRYGQASPPTQSNKPLSPSSIKSAESLITRKKSTTTHDSIALIFAEGDQVAPTATRSMKNIEQLISLVSTYPAPDKGTKHHRLPLWAHLVILVDLAILIYWFRKFTRTTQHLVFPLTAALLVMLSFALMDITQHWMPLTPSLLMLAIGWIYPIAKRRSTSSIHEYHTADPKPVIRA